MGAHLKSFQRFCFIRTCEKVNFIEEGIGQNIPHLDKTNYIRQVRDFIFEDLSYIMTKQI